MADVAQSVVKPAQQDRPDVGLPTLAVEVMETGVRRTRDGHLVMVHDETVEPTTDGHGRVSDLTLAQINALHLRQDMGGAAQPLTDQTVPTLAEMLAHAKGRILLNLDVKDAIHADVVAEVERAGLWDGVIVKTVVGTGSLPLAAIASYDRAPFAVILVSGDGSGQTCQGSSTRRWPPSGTRSRSNCPISPNFASRRSRHAPRRWACGCGSKHYSKALS